MQLAKIKRMGANPNFVKMIWKKPKGNYELLLSTLTSLFENEVVVTRVMNNNFMYFDINNISESFKDDFPNDLFDPDDKTRSSFFNGKKE